LPAQLTNLNCSINQLTNLPKLSASLLKLYCSNNQLKRLPALPAALKSLFCGNNQLTNLPVLPTTLTNFYCGQNPINLAINVALPIHLVRINIHIINKFRFIFYSLKCKRRLRNFLWLKIREPKIKAQFHPCYLANMNEETDLDAFIDEWVKINEYK
jgi:Leucine-rich repeat (LRR) protein